jgi:hypothetical protein
MKDHPSYLSAYEDGTECSETSAYKIQMPGYYPEESIQQNFTTTFLKALLVFKVVTILFYILFSPFEQKHVFPRKKCRTPSSTATGVQHTAMPYHWDHDVLTGIFQRTKKVII